METDYKVTITMGHGVLESRLVYEGEKIKFQSRSKHYDINNKLIETTDWETTGTLVYQ